MENTDGLLSSPLASPSSMPPTPNSVEQPSQQHNSVTMISSVNGTSAASLLEKMTPPSMGSVVTSTCNNRLVSDDDPSIDVLSSSSSSSSSSLSACSSVSSSAALLNNSISTVAHTSKNQSLISVHASNVPVTSALHTSASIAGRSSLLHSPSSNSSNCSVVGNDGINGNPNTFLDRCSPVDEKASLADHPAKKFKSFLIEDILSARQKQQQLQAQQQRQLLLLQQQQLLFLSQQASNPHLHLQSPHSPQTTNNSTQFSHVDSKHKLDSLMFGGGANPFTSGLFSHGLYGSIVRPWDLVSATANGGSSTPVTASAAAVATGSLPNQPVPAATKPEETISNKNQTRFQETESLPVTTSTNGTAHASLQPVKSELNLTHPSIPLPKNPLQGLSTQQLQQLQQLQNHVAMAHPAYQAMHFPGFSATPLSNPLTVAHSLASSVNPLAQGLNSLSQNPFLLGLHGLTPSSQLSSGFHSSVAAAAAAAASAAAAAAFHPSLHNLTNGVSVPSSINGNIGTTTTLTRSSSPHKHLQHKESPNNVSAKVSNCQSPSQLRSSNSPSSSTATNVSAGSQPIRNGNSYRSFRKINVDQLDDEMDSQDEDDMEDDDEGGHDSENHGGRTKNGINKCRNQDGNEKESSPLNALFKLANQDFMNAERNGKQVL